MNEQYFNLHCLAQIEIVTMAQQKFSREACINPGEEYEKN
jgi:hypothetical protein